jgi:5-hydroxyisourate hydrolase-like protein (transthyretin family)
LAEGLALTSRVPFVHVLLRGSSAARDGETDREGRYDFGGVPPGTYELQLIPPAVFDAEHLRRTVEVRDPRACVAADFNLAYDGSISGVLVTADGGAADDVQVELVSGEALWISQTLTTKTNRHGEFQFKQLSPGRYGVGVSLRRTLEPSVLYPKIFYPGTPSESYAAVLELGEGAHLQLDPLRLQPARPTRELTGIVAWPDGRPAAGASVRLVDERGERGVSQSNATTDGDGRFKLLVHEGMTYRVRAHHTLKTAMGIQQLDALDEAFVTSAQLPSPRLILTPALKP